METKFKGRASRQNEVGLQILDIASELIYAQESARQPLPYYEETVGAGSPLIGLSIGKTQFWQTTGATIVGIRRGKRTILSPGPDAVLYAGDCVIFVCEKCAAEAVRRLVNGTN